MAGKDILDIIGICAACGCPVFWLMGAINMFRMVQHRKPGVRLFPNWYESPFNIMFRPSQLTETGLRARRRVFIGFFGFMGCWAIGFTAFGFAGR